MTDEKNLLNALLVVYHAVDEADFERLKDREGSLKDIAEICLACSVEGRLTR